MKTIQELRAAVRQAAKPIGHPFKTYNNVGLNTRLLGVDHKFGPLVYIEGGAVEGKFGTLKAPRYLIAHGETHDESIWGLAKALGVVDYGPDNVEEIDAGTFWLYSNPEGKLPAED